LRQIPQSRKQHQHMDKTTAAGIIRYNKVFPDDHSNQIHRQKFRLIGRGCRNTVFRRSVEQIEACTSVEQIELKLFRPWVYQKKRNPRLKSTSCIENKSLFKDRGDPVGAVSPRKSTWQVIETMYYAWMITMAENRERDDRVKNSCKHLEVCMNNKLLWYMGGGDTLLIMEDDLDDTESVEPWPRPYFERSRINVHDMAIWAREIEDIMETNQNSENIQADAYFTPKVNVPFERVLVMHGTRIVIPQALRNEVLHLAHEGHQGIVKMKNRLRSKVWWPKMDGDAERISIYSGADIKADITQFNPSEQTNKYYDIVETHLSTSQLGQCGPRMPRQEEQLLIEIINTENLLTWNTPTLLNDVQMLRYKDHFTDPSLRRFFEVVIMKSTTTQKVIEVLTPIFARYGYPFTLKSDNGAQFVLEEFEDFLTESGIQHRKSPPLWPQANEEVERQNRTLLKSLKVAHVENKKWKDELNKFLLAYRTTPHSSTGVSPVFMMFGRELKTKLPELRPDKNILDESIRDRDWNKKVAVKEYADKHRQANQNPINPGEKVLLKNSKTSGKLDPKFETKPYIVQTKGGQELTVKSDEGVVYRADKQTIPNDVASGGSPEMISGSIQRSEKEPLRFVGYSEHSTVLFKRGAINVQSTLLARVRYTKIIGQIVDLKNWMTSSPSGTMILFEREQFLVPPEENIRLSRIPNGYEETGDEEQQHVKEEEMEEEMEVLNLAALPPRFPGFSLSGTRTTSFLFS
ncbi:Neural cell adhesion molecule 1, partial [Paramuricea clavata]